MVSPPLHGKQIGSRDKNTRGILNQVRKEAIYGWRKENRMKYLNNYQKEHYAHIYLILRPAEKRNWLKWATDKGLSLTGFTRACINVRIRGPDLLGAADLSKVPEGIPKEFLRSS